jgi:hypothetical protein
MIRFKCPRCAAVLEHETAHEKVQCSKCGQRIRVPTPPLPSIPFAPPPPNKTVLGEWQAEPPPERKEPVTVLDRNLFDFSETKLRVRRISLNRKKVWSNNRRTNTRNIAMRAARQFGCVPKSAPSAASDNQCQLLIGCLLEWLRTVAS